MQHYSLIDMELSRRPIKNRLANTRRFLFRFACFLRLTRN
jgi:hypothetical protein